MHARRMCRRMAPQARFTQATQRIKHASNLTQAISCDKFQPCHRPLVAYVALLALCASRCMHKAGTALYAGCQQREDVVEWYKCRTDNTVLKGMTASCHGRLADISRPFKFYLLNHWKEVILCLILDIRYLKRLSASGGLCPLTSTRGSATGPPSPWAP